MNAKHVLFATIMSGAALISAPTQSPAFSGFPSALSSAASAVDMRVDVARVKRVGPGHAVVKPVGRPAAVVVRPGAARVVRPGVAVRPAAARVWPVRAWVRRPWFGTVVAGVTLGAIVYATTVGVAPAVPAPNLCWYWTDPSYSQGYWSYCS
jgi:hypothetical protein